MFTSQSLIFKGLAIILVAIGLVSGSTIWPTDLPNNENAVNIPGIMPAEGTTPTEGITPPTEIIPEAGTVSSTSAPLPKGIPPTVNPNRKPDMCGNTKIDAMFNSAEGRTYAFKGAYYYMITETSIAKGYPKRISESWKDLPNDIDAAFSYKHGKSYFFKGCKIWRYSGLQLDDGYPKNINDDFTGIPDNLDAAMNWNSGVVFFKGSNYWYFDAMDTPHVHPDYPKPISDWSGVPDNLDAALEYVNGGYTYFFKDHEFYRFNNAELKIDDAYAPYPRSTAIFWFDCKPERMVTE